MKLKLETLNPKLRERIEAQIREEDNAARSRSGAVIQNRKARHNLQDSEREDLRPTHHQQKASSLDGGNHRRFRFAITLSVRAGNSGDPDGALSTLLDCAVRAVQRFSELHSGIGCKCDHHRSA